MPGVLLNGYGVKILLRGLADMYAIAYQASFFTPLALSRCCPSAIDPYCGAGVPARWTEVVCES